jgi:PIN domain nuclease of toxin-antitoxin system
MISRAESQGVVRISPVSMFEIASLHTAGRLRLSRSPERWIRESLETPGVRTAELSSAIAIDAGSIPREALSDPVDRFLVATARQLDAIFLTSDARILDYARETGNVRVQDGGR